MNVDKTSVFKDKRLLYTAYGLKIESEILLPELLQISDEGDRQTDVTITYGIVPKSLTGILNSNKYIQVSKDEFCLYIPEVAHYYVGFGNTIIVEPDDNSDAHSIKLFILASCMGMLFIQKNILAIHGGAVEIDGQGVIITGETGAGKSTLVSAFVKEGHMFLSDDVSVIDNDSNSGVKVFPAYPQNKLCKDAMSYMGYNVELFTQIDKYRDKYAIPINKSFINSPIPLKHIFEIVIDNSGNDQTRAYELFGSEKVMAFMNSIYRKEFYNLTGHTPVSFKHCINIIKKIQLFRILRPAKAFSVELQIEIIMDLIKDSKTMERCV